jgi:hypothetical protein
MTMSRRRVRLQIGAIAVTAAACVAMGCASKSGNDMPGGPDGGGPGGDGSGAAITVKVFPDGVPSVTGAMVNADLVAYQDGDGDWTEATGTGGVYQFHVTADRYGVAIGCGGEFGGTEFYYQSVAEARELAVNGCSEPTEFADVEITVSAPAPSSPNEIWIGGWPAFEVGVGQLTTISVDKGVRDVYARSYFPVFNGQDDVKIYRGPALDVEADTAIAIDWSQAKPADSFPVTISDPANTPGTWSLVSMYLTPHGEGMHEVQLVFDKPTMYATLPAALRQPGDVMRVEVNETGSSSAQNGPLPARHAYQEMASPAAVTLTPPDYLTATAPKIDTNAVSQLSLMLPIAAPKLGHTISEASFTTSSLGMFHYQRMFVRPGWAAGAASVALRVPDLRNLASWTVNMELTGRNEVDWELSVTDQDQPFDAPLTQDRSGTISELFGKVVPPGRTSVASAVTAANAATRAMHRGGLRRSPLERRAP